MVDFQVVVAGPEAARVDADESRFAVEQHSGKVLGTIEKLGEVWDLAVARLSALAAATQRASTTSGFSLDSIEFSIGIEAGTSVGLVTKGEASVTLTFVRSSDAPVA